MSECVEEEDCPLCLEPLPPFWAKRGRATSLCCGKAMCKSCHDNKEAYIERARAEGTFGRDEEQINSTCPLCREKLPTDSVGKMMVEKYEKGRLPLNLYSALGVSFIIGQEVEINMERGIEILMLGAKKGDPGCQYHIGSRYGHGDDGLPKSIAEAKRWLLAATEQGHAIAELCLAVLLKKEEGDDAGFVRHVRGSASKGSDDACYELGGILAEGGLGVQKSIEEAIRVVTPAAERGHARSMCLLGAALCQPEPWAPPPDNPGFTRGVHLLRQVAATGDQLAVSLLKKLEQSLNGGASNKCFGCNKEAPFEKAFLRCSRCRAAWYCSKDCQRRHWKVEAGHKQFCIKWEQRDVEGDRCSSI